MRILIAIALLIVGASAAAQPRAVYSVDTITNLAARYPTSNETVAVLNRTSTTNFGPIEFWRHAPYSTISTNATNALSAINGGRWLKTAVDVAGGTGGAGISGLLVNGSGLVTNLVDSSSVTITGTNGQATFTATTLIFNGLLECLDDATVHTLTVTKLGTNYLLGVTQATNAPGPYATSIPMSADDLTTHMMRVRLVGTNYLLEITQ